MDQIVGGLAATSEVPKGFVTLEVQSVHHYTERLFSFTTQRPAGFRFRSGEFAMIGLMVDCKPLVRAYSIASPNWEEHLEFYSIKVPDGPLTSRLQNIQIGDEILIRPKPVGTLVFDALLPGKRLFLLSTGTGIAPFSSVIRDPEVYEKFDQIHLLHTCREVAELQYGEELVQSVHAHEYLGELAVGKLHHHPSATRETYKNTGRIDDWIKDGRLARLCGGDLTPDTDRVMICGSMAMLDTLKGICEEHGFLEGSNSKPGQFVIEKAFAG
ncbi:ferredoxin--NADP reductase [Shimia sagamensis]|uniref:ferredoxin--NADP(+) reductase n=1 Tax=Shimia sagamensis TaxID=1566352 RepID=A0ABY1N5G4_9RHOB|nr:ferredoxin--NADP reductase [Shimia sagamensis]SMP00633.1 ferredoxin--NADP+ reductase [Shimia sagamensis]